MSYEHLQSLGGRGGFCDVPMNLFNPYNGRAFIFEWGEGT
jgi:hypothetical protein